MTFIMIENHLNETRLDKFSAITYIDDRFVTLAA